MECYYHPGKESANTCAICGKSVCEECGLEIAGKFYCKECLEKIIGVESQKTSQAAEPVKEKPVEAKPAVDDNIYQKREEEIDYIPQQEEVQQKEVKGISNDSPYNIRDNMEYSGGPETSYIAEKTQPKPHFEQKIAQPAEAPQTLTPREDTDFIYPDHTYEPPKTSARQELEDRYEKYLDDLYFDENEIPLNEQLAKDEEQYGSLTRKEYVPQAQTEPREEVRFTKQEEPKIETPEEMEARIRAEILKEQGLANEEAPKKRFSLRNKNKQEDIEDTSIHNLNYQNEKEPMTVVDIALSIVLVIVILIVLYYLVYLFMLSATYPTFTDAIFALNNPQNVINALMTHTL